MTCIVGVRHDGKVYIGGDSAGVGGYDLHIRSDQKVFTNGKFVMGFTSSFRMGQLLQYALNPPFHNPEVDLYRYMVTDFVNAVRDCLKTGGYARKDKEEEGGGTFLVGTEGRLFRIEEDYQVAEVPEGYDSVGCGFAYALGVLYTQMCYTDPTGRIHLALEAAERYSAGVRGPFHIVSL